MLGGVRYYGRDDVAEMHYLGTVVKCSIIAQRID